MKGDGTNYWTRILRDLEMQPEAIDLPATEKWAEDVMRDRDDTNAITGYLNDIPEDKRTERVDRIIKQLKFLTIKVEEAERRRLTELINLYQRKIAEGVPSVMPQKKMSFTAEDAISITGKSKNTIYKHLSSGKLKAKKDATEQWVITREALEEYTQRTDF